MSSRKGFEMSIRMVVGLLVALATVVILAMASSKYAGELTKFVTQNVLQGLFGG